MVVQKKKLFRYSIIFNGIFPFLRYCLLVANIFKHFLTKYQTEKPRHVPFKYYDIKKIICNILEVIVKPEVLVKVKKPRKLENINLSNNNNLNKAGEITTGFAVNCKIKKLKQKDVSTSDIKMSKKAVHNFVVAISEALLERT